METDVCAIGSRPTTQQLADAMSIEESKPDCLDRIATALTDKVKREGPGALDDIAPPAWKPYFGNLRGIGAVPKAENNHLTTAGLETRVLTAAVKGSNDMRQLHARAAELELPEEADRLIKQINRLSPEKRLAFIATADPAMKDDKKLVSERMFGYVGDVRFSNDPRAKVVAGVLIGLQNHPAVYKQAVASLAMQKQLPTVAAAALGYQGDQHYNKMSPGETDMKIIARYNTTQLTMLHGATVAVNDQDTSALMASAFASARSEFIRLHANLGPRGPVPNDEDSRIQIKTQIPKTLYDMAALLEELGNCGSTACPTVPAATLAELDATTPP